MLPAQAEDGITVIPVQFPPGASSAELSGSITGEAITDYTLAAKAGQTMTAEIQSTNLQLYFNVIPPDATDEADFVGSLSGNEYSGVLDLDGAWKVRVYLYRAASLRGETADYKLTVGITGKPDPSMAREPNDFGPRDWDARGDLYCASGGGDLALDCPFKVLRYGAGEATIFVQEQNGQVRILYFQSGKFSTDSAETVTTGKEADNWTVTVSGETYQFPDAVLTGG